MIIVVCNTKGGTSKSTLAVNLAVEYHRQAYAQSLSEGLSVVEYDNAKAKAEIQLLAQEITNLLTTAEGEEN